MRSRQDRFLPGVPGRHIERLLDDAPGNELETGKFDRPTSSATLAVNTFGFFLYRAADLPPLPGFDQAWSPHSLEIEKTIRFPWRGGRHPVPDCLITTGVAALAVECKRFEPFRKRDHGRFSGTFWRTVWGDQMDGYQRVRDLVHANMNTYTYLDAAQLVKHALALRHEAQPGNSYDGLTPILLYVYAEPDNWPDGSPIQDEARARHRDEIADFASHVTGDEVAFRSCSYQDVLDIWQRHSDEGIAQHATAVIRRFSP